MVSVIIPNYNHSGFLKERIDSVLKQTYQDFELIILDDCSTDNSREIIEQYRGNEKVSNIIYNKSNGGSVFKQWEKGIAMAAGEYIWIAESDDAADFGFLQMMIEFIENDDRIGLVYSDSKIIKSKVDTGKRFSTWKNEVFETSRWSEIFVNDGVSEITDFLWKSCTVNNASAVIFRKKALIEANPFDLRFKFIGDWYCYLKICKLYKIGYIGKPLNFYREHDNNTSIKLYNDMNYVLEYFMLYNWISKSFPQINKKKLQGNLISYLSHSLLRGWSKSKLLVYYKMFRINPRLFFSTIKGLTVAIIKSRMGKFRKPYMENK